MTSWAGTPAEATPTLCAEPFATSFGFVDVADVAWWLLKIFASEGDIAVSSESVAPFVLPFLSPSPFIPEKLFGLEAVLLTTEYPFDPNTEFFRL